MGFTANFSDFKRFKGDLDKLTRTLQERERTAVNLAGNAYKTDVQAIIAVGKEHGGTLRRSVHVEPSEAGGRPISLVGSNAPYARRIEFGFWDMTDSLGRHFYQRPQPAWRPAFDLNKAKYGRIMVDYMNATNTATAGDFVMGEY